MGKFLLFILGGHCYKRKCKRAATNIFLIGREIDRERERFSQKAPVRICMRTGAEPSGFFFCDDWFIVLLTLRFFFGRAVFRIFVVRIVVQLCHFHLQNFFYGCP